MTPSGLVCLAADKPGGWSLPEPIYWSDAPDQQQISSYLQRHQNPYADTGWRMPCANFTELDQPVDKARVTAVRTAVLRLGEELKRKHGTTYFPFSRYGDGLRATQGYLVKFPAELLDLLPELREAMLAFATVAPQAPVRPRKGAGRLQDAALRKAIEEHAMARAREHYLEAGASEVEVLGKPYDLLVRGPEGERHVEVKGSSLRIDKVLLTINEVLHARAYEATDLFVVDEIDWQLKADGSYTTDGGRQRIWRSWNPADDQLSALQYQYELGNEEP